MSNYTPRRCNKRWLDSDCPAEILAIIHHTDDHGGGYDVIFADVQIVRYETRAPQYWLTGLSVTASGIGTDHFELQAHQVAAYRYRFKHRYTKWSTLPAAVKNAVRKDISAAKKWMEEHA